MRVTFNVTGPLIWLDENGEPNGTFDVFDYIALVRDHYAKNGIGADYIDQLMRSRGGERNPVRYKRELSRPRPAGGRGRPRRPRRP